MIRDTCSMLTMLLAVLGTAALLMLLHVTSMDVPVGPSSDKTVVDTVPDQHISDPVELLQDSDLSQSLDSWLDELSEKQREVIARRFGLRGHEMSTLEEVGREIGLTRERVRQIQVEALRRMKDILEKQGLNASALFGVN